MWNCGGTDCPEICIGELPVAGTAVFDKIDLEVGQCYVALMLADDDDVTILSECSGFIYEGLVPE